MICPLFFSRTPTGMLKAFDSLTVYLGIARMHQSKLYLNEISISVMLIQGTSCSLFCLVPALFVASVKNFITTSFLQLLFKLLFSARILLLLPSAVFYGPANHRPFPALKKSNVRICGNFQGHHSSKRGNITLHRDEFDQGGDEIEGWQERNCSKNSDGREFFRGFFHIETATELLPSNSSVMSSFFWRKTHKNKIPCLPRKKSQIDLASSLKNAKPPVFTLTLPRRNSPISKSHLFKTNKCIWRFCAKPIPEKYSFCCLAMYSLANLLPFDPFGIGAAPPPFPHPGSKRATEGA